MTDSTDLNPADGVAELMRAAKTVSLPLRRRVVSAIVERERIPDMMRRDIAEVYEAVAITETTPLTWAWSPGWIEPGPGDSLTIYVPLWDAVKVERAPWVKATCIGDQVRWTPGGQLTVVVLNGERL